CPRYRPKAVGLLQPDQAGESIPHRAIAEVPKSGTGAGHSCLVKAIVAWGIRRGLPSDRHYRGLREAETAGHDGCDNHDHRKLFHLLAHYRPSHSSRRWGVRFAIAAGISRVHREPQECGASVGPWRDRVNIPKDGGRDKILAVRSP